MIRCTTIALAVAVPCWCSHGARGRSRRGGAGAGSWSLLLPLSRPMRCVWRAAPFGFPLSSPAGTVLQVVCAFRELGPVALPVRAACLLPGVALALPRLPPPPSPIHLARAPREAPLRGAGRAVPGGPCASALTARVPCSSCLAWRGLARSPRLPAYLPVVCPHEDGSVWLGSSAEAARGRGERILAPLAGWQAPILCRGARSGLQ